MNSRPDFEKDIAKACQATDERLLRLLKQASREATSATASTDANSTPQSSRGSENGPRQKRPKPKRPKPSKQPQANTQQWGPPTTLLNTRIPPEMAELLDELVYRQRKERRKTGATVTKQSLVCEAIGDLLKKYRVVG
jgi:hypothetical protein